MKYELGKPYNVQKDTENKHHFTWARIKEVINRQGFIDEDHARSICRLDNNGPFFAYVVRNDWLREVV